MRLSVRLHGRQKARKIDFKQLSFSYKRKEEGDKGSVHTFSSMLELPDELITLVVVL
jgi:hypothetical protein